MLPIERTLGYRHGSVVMDAEAQLLEHFVPRCLEPRFGVAFLERFAKRTSAMTTENLRPYALDADVRLHGSRYGQRFKGKFFDTTFNFCLTHDGTLIASLGFEVDEDVMNIWQIQGVKGQGPHLEPIKWERALVQYAVDWARDRGLRQVVVASVERVGWAAQQGHLDPALGKLRYDVTAKRCGFRAGQDGYYVKALRAGCDQQ